MAAIYTIVGLGECLIFMTSAIVVTYVIVRAALRFIFIRRNPAHRIPSKEEMQHLKRADSRMAG